MMKKIICLLMSLLVFLFASCSEEVVKKDPNEFMIVTSFYPVYVTTANLIEGADDVRLVNLTKPESGCMHSYMLTTEDMKKLNAADLFIVSGMGMEAFMEKSSLGIPGLDILDCGEDISRELGDEDENRYNPHYWMNIENAMDQCEKIKKTLCRLDPENAAIYEKNAAGYRAELEALIPEAKARVGKLQNKDMVVFHESFDYFADEFGLNIVSVLSNHDGSAPSPKKIAETVDYMKQNDIKVVFTEKGATSNDALNTVKKETGCTVYVLDTMTSGKTDSKVKDAYINAIRANLDVLEKALG